MRREMLAAAIIAATMAGGAAGATPAQIASQTTTAADSPRDAVLDYVLGASDQVRVIVYGEPDLTGQFTISTAGQIAFPLVGDVPAAGLTVATLASAIADRLRDGYLKDPRVSVEIAVARPFYILGEVEKPGEYPFASGLTARKAVATAGGYTYRANTKMVFIRHPQTGVEEKVPLDSDVAIEPGDTIRVGERYF